MQKYSIKNKILWIELFDRVLSNFPLPSREDNASRWKRNCSFTLAASFGFDDRFCLWSSLQVRVRRKRIRHGANDDGRGREKEKRITDHERKRERDSFSLPHPTTWNSTVVTIFSSYENEIARTHVRTPLPFGSFLFSREWSILRREERWSIGN